MGKSVLVPTSLVKQIIDLLGHWDVSRHDRAVRDGYGDILNSLNVKLQKLELRDAYAKIVAADNQDGQHDARINYLLHKARLNNMSADDYTV